MSAHALHATRLVGRDGDLADVGEALRLHRLVTLTGVAGVGKTRLAMEAAGAVAERFEAVAVTELASCTGPDDVGLCLAAAFGVPEGAGARDPAAALTAHVGSRAVLVVLDNCEHVVAAAAAACEALLVRCPALAVLATSRAALGCTGEHVTPVSPLPAEAACELFAERAAAAGVASVADDAGAIAAVCRELGGIPLAIELAASRVTHLSMGELAEWLAARADLLAARGPGVPDRHRSLDAALDCSHELLAPLERTVFRRLAVFASGAELAAAEAVCGSGEVARADVLHAVGSLVDSSLVVADRSARTTRFQMLAPVRRYALARLDDAGEAAEAAAAHARWCARHIEEAGGEILALPAADQAEVVAALRAAVAAGDGDAACRLAAGAWRWWEVTGRLAEGRALLDDAIALSGEQDAELRAGVLAAAGHLAFRGGDYATARTLYERALDQRGGAAGGGTLSALAMAALFDGDHDAARVLAGCALARSADAEDARGVAFAHASLARVAMAERRHDEAEEQFLSSLAILRRIGCRREAASVLENLGEVAEDRGDDARAHRFYEGALQLSEGEGDDRGAALALNSLSLVARRRRNLDRAVELAEEAIDRFRAIGDRPGAAAALNNLAGLVAERGDPARAMRLYVQSAQEFRATADPAGEATSLQNLGDLAARCGDVTLERRCAAATAALRGRVTSRRHDPIDLRELAPPSAHGGQLTRRERQVAGLVARGMTNRQIAGELFVSERTVESHMANIRSKLGADSRTKVARWALERGLV